MLVALQRRERSALPYFQSLTHLVTSRSAGKRTMQSSLLFLSNVSSMPGAQRVLVPGLLPGVVESCKSCSVLESAIHDAVICSLGQRDRIARLYLVTAPYGRRTGSIIGL